MFFSSRSSAPAWWARPRREIQFVAVSNSTECPAWVALMPSPMARWVLPMPGGPSSTTLSALGTNVAVARCARTSLRSEGRWSRLKSSRVLTCGKCAVRTRIMVPADSRSATWRSSTAVRYSSWDQFASRAWAARSSQTRPMVGVLSTRVRYASFEPSASGRGRLVAVVVVVTLVVVVAVLIYIPSDMTAAVTAPGSGRGSKSTPNSAPGGQDRPHPGQDVPAPTAGDHDRAGDPRVPARHRQHRQHPLPTGLPISPDRDRAWREPQVALGDLARGVLHPVARVRRHEQRPQQAHPVLQHRQRPVPPDALSDHRRRHVRELGQHRPDRRLERPPRRALRRPLVPRRTGRRQRLGDRVPRDPQTPGDRRLRQPLRQVQPTDLGPILHTDHTPSRRTPGCSTFTRRLRPSFHASATGG